MRSSFVVPGFFFTAGFFTGPATIWWLATGLPTWIALLVIFVILVLKKPIPLSFVLGAGTFLIYLAALGGFLENPSFQELGSENKRIIVIGSGIVAWVTGMFFYGFFSDKESL